MTDLLKMLPHSKKDAKVDLKEGVGSINEIADMEVIRTPALVRALTQSTATRTATFRCCLKFDGRKICMSGCLKRQTVRQSNSNAQTVGSAASHLSIHWLVLSSAHPGRAQAHWKLPQGACQLHCHGSVVDGCGDEVRL